MDFGWSDFAKFCANVVKLTSSVATLQKQLEAAARKIGEQQKELEQIKADLRVARAELEGVAIKAATSTVLQTHEQMISRLVNVENILAVSSKSQLPKKNFNSEK